MTQMEFELQVKRLKVRWPRALDDEFTLLLANEVNSEDSYWFKTLVDRMIGERKHTNPPLLVDFREAAKRYNNWKRESRNLSAVVDNCAVYSSDKLKNLLKKYDCETVLELVRAVSTLRRLNRLSGDDEYKNLSDFKPCEGLENME